MKLTRLDFLGVVVVAVGLAGAFCVDAAHAQTQVCGPGKDCVSHTFQTPPVPRARFTSCNKSRTGQLAFDGDAGAYRVCQYDGGWEALGGGGGDAYWGTPIGVDRLSTIGTFYQVDIGGPSTSAVALGNQAYVFDDGATSIEMYGAEGGFISAQLGALCLRGESGSPVGCMQSDGWAINNTTAVNGFPEATFFYDGGTTIAAGGTYSQHVSFPGAAAHDICIIEQHDKSSGAFLISCAVEGTDQVQINWYNHTAGTPTAACAFSDPTCGRRVRLIQKH